MPEIGNGLREPVAHSGVVIDNQDVCHGTSISNSEPLSTGTKRASPPCARDFYGDQAQAGSFGTPCHEGLEQSLPYFGRHALAGVLDAQTKMVCNPLRRNLNSAPRRHLLDCVRHEVINGSLHLRIVDLRRRRRWLRLGHELNALAGGEFTVTVRRALKAFRSTSEGLSSRLCVIARRSRSRASSRPTCSRIERNADTPTSFVLTGQRVFSLQSHGGDRVTDFMGKTGGETAYRSEPFRRAARRRSSASRTPVAFSAFTRRSSSRSPVRGNSGRSVRGASCPARAASN